MQGQPALKIKIQDHFQTRFEATNSMAISELANELLLKIVFFDISYVVSVCVKFNILIFGGLFGKPRIPLDSCSQVDFNFKL